MSLAVALLKCGAKVIAFPQDRNAGKVRHVACVLASKDTPRAKRAYWEQVIRGLQSSLLRAGLSPDETDYEVQRFRTAVSNELARTFENVGSATQPSGG